MKKIGSLLSLVAVLLLPGCCCEEMCEKDCKPASKVVHERKKAHKDEARPKKEKKVKQEKKAKKSSKKKGAAKKKKNNSEGDLKELAWVSQIDSLDSLSA